MRPESEISSIIENDFGANATYVVELLRQYQSNPRSVDEEWSDYFHALFNGGDGVSGNGAAATPAQAAQPAPAATTINGAATAKTAVTAPPAAPTPSPTAQTPAAVAPSPEKMPIRGPALRIVENMEASLALPIATSQRQIQIKVLDENRRLINQFLSLGSRGKASFTHLIAWAVIRALEKYPQLNDGYEEIGGASYRVKRESVNLGVAVDVTKKDGSRSLLVPNIKGANKMTFAEFLNAYQQTVVKARDGKLQVPDFQGTTISLTNPGTLGTTASNPRLMPGQGAIIATGAIEYPPEYSAMMPEALSQLGISKVMTITSTYDHRIIQGAESGAFLGMIDELLRGQHEFYDMIFAELNIPYKPLRWAVDLNPALLGGDRRRAEEIKKQAHVFELINAYRSIGHLIAEVDPLGMTRRYDHRELDLETYGLTIWDLDREFLTFGLGGTEKATLREILDMLHRFYWGTVGTEYLHIHDSEQKQWIRQRIESAPPKLSPETRRQILAKLIASEQFERFLHTKYLGQKRFSVEGNDTIIPMLDQLIEGAVARGVEDIVFGMSHRGRLTMLSNVLGDYAERIFTIFEGTTHPNFPADEGDVKYHQGAINSRETAGKKVGLTLASNPSHLEFVDPVVEGIARAKQDAIGVTREEARQLVLPVLMHGDAAFAGQGVVSETLNLADLKGYRTGGTIHIVINNQIGFTTTPESGRSTIYSTDVAKTTQAPIFHVNSDDAETAHNLVQIALDFRQKFNKDVVIDLIGFRRHGHNEGDEPSYTQPLMYQRVKEHPGVRELYSQQLIREGVLTRAEVDEMIRRQVEHYESILVRAREVAASKPPIVLIPESIEEPDGSDTMDTDVAREVITNISNAIGKVPQGFNLNPKMVSQMARRIKMGTGEAPIDWGFAEALAFGSLVMEGTSVRLSGQDSGRGTFSQRHAILYDTKTGQPWVPHEQLQRNGARFQVFDSSLSEAGVLGFEYGYSVVAKNSLVLWEAQFGDFANAAQVMIDQFVVSGEQKWQQTSRLGLLLPHGNEGQGPEHSSARLERFLQLCADNNIQVCYPTTPAQYFHLLRRQIKQPQSKPLIVMTPKSLLRAPEATSSIDDFTSGGFRPAIPEPVSDPAKVSRLVLCSGKVFYDLKAKVAETGNDHVAVMRLEQLYPFPHRTVRQWLASFPNANDVIWCQEEHRNQGAWTFVRPRILYVLREGQELDYAGRNRSASPATGSYSVHQLEQQQLIKDALG
ncbi:MAG TPA: multifunctional oxoglutarate decarboxylase/oxoglutarate dehydrogenase thiamine pyrophosphate-binding subunit/dihydrolipoyllysine-residue succinyltransferase subunit [Blastocatellia bacterium]|nr:multifunctional oxoglutarate decarboxylase/oxoglutarate dehydrogenase thiamine pyrophosphate-binding subunit/dihydrolipoyllysine-residue succinyltransferase subunit [Blastocatellia bacterium]